MAQNKRDDRPLDGRETTDYLIDRARDAVLAADASVLDKVRGLEALAAAATKLAASLREGNHDAVIAERAREAEVAVAKAVLAFNAFVEAVKAPQVLATHPVDVREMGRFLEETRKMHARVDAWATLYEARVTDVVAQVGALEPQAPEHVPAIVKCGAPDQSPEPDLPF